MDFANIYRKEFMKYTIDEIYEIMKIMNKKYVDIYVNGKINAEQLIDDPRIDNSESINLRSMNIYFRELKLHLIRIKEKYTNLLINNNIITNKNDNIIQTLKKNNRLKLMKENLNSSSAGAIELYNNIELLNTIGIIDIMLLIIVKFSLILYYFRNK